MFWRSMCNRCGLALIGNSKSDFQVSFPWYCGKMCKLYVDLYLLIVSICSQLSMTELFPVGKFEGLHFGMYICIRIRLWHQFDHNHKQCLSRYRAWHPVKGHGAALLKALMFLQNVECWLCFVTSFQLYQAGSDAPPIQYCFIGAQVTKYLAYAHYNKWDSLLNMIMWDSAFHQVARVYFSA